MNNNVQPQRNFEDYVFYAEKTGDDGLMPVPANAFIQCPGKPGQPGVRSTELTTNVYTGPVARANALLAYDSTRKAVVLFGGTGASSYNDTWEWNGKKWTLISTVSSPPANSPDGPACMAYDVANGEIVLFTYPGETWTYNGTNWIQKSPATSPPTRDSAGMAYDPVREKIVMFGGADVSGSPIYYNDTWEWDGTNWTQLTPATTPSTRFGVAMEYDGNGIIMFGGQDSATNNNLNETWRWNGTNWTQLTPATSPPVRITAAMTAYLNDNILLHGGADGGALTDTWLWNGTTWINQSPTHQPTSRVDSRMSYDIEKNEVILFGGYSSPSYLNDTWKYVDDDWEKTAIYTEKHVVINLPFNFNFCGVDYTQIAIGIDGDAILIDPSSSIAYEQGENFKAEGTVFALRGGDIKNDVTNANVKQHFLNEKHVVIMPWADQYTTSYSSFDQYTGNDPDEYGDAYYDLTSTEIQDLKNGVPPYIATNGGSLEEYKIDEIDYAVRYCTTNTPEGPAFVVRWNVIAGHVFDT